MLFAILTLLSGLSISLISGFFSIIGLTQIFSASYYSVIIMGTVLELGKIISCTWLHKHWNDTSVSMFHKLYLIIAIMLTMFITSLGIFGFLTESHLQQKAPIIEQLTSKENAKENIDYQKSQLDILQNNLTQINSISNNKNNNSLDRQRNQITKEMTKIRQQINDSNQELFKNKQQISKVELKLGPIKYLADLLYGKSNEENIDKSVQIFIIMIMIVFDPLAVILILSANISFKQYFENKEKLSESAHIQAIEPDIKGQSVIEKEIIIEQPIQEEIINSVEGNIVHKEPTKEIQHQINEPPIKQSVPWAAFGSKPKSN